MPVTPEGIIVPRMPEIVETIQQEQREKIDPNINNRSDNLLSELNNIFARQASKVNELLEEVRDSRHILKAEGKNLDDLVAQRKMYRIGASRSFTNFQIFRGRNGTTIPQGRVLTSPSTNDRFYLASSVSVNVSSCYEAVFSIPSNIVGAVFSILVDGVLLTHTSSSSDTPATIIAELYSQYQGVGEPSFNMTIVPNGDILVRSKMLSSIRINTTLNIQNEWVGSFGRIEAFNEGSVIAPSETVTVMLIPHPNITSTTNLEALVVGRLRETDEELRRRALDTRVSGGTATPDAIVSRIYNEVQGITFVDIAINAKDTYDIDGRPPHSYEVIVLGGDDDEVARSLWRAGAAAIEMVGNITYEVLDTNGNPRTVKFTRPAPITVGYRVTYSIYDEEEFPSDGASLIRTAIQEYNDSLGNGVDIIPTRAYGGIYQKVSGIDNLLVEVQVIQGGVIDPDNWVTIRIPISSTQYAYTNPLFIQVQDL